MITLEDATEEAANELVLTDRWYAMRPHQQQSLLYHHPARFKECAAGRRSGKTETLKRHVALNQLILPKSGLYPRRAGITAPTYTRAKEIYFEDLRALIPKRWVKSIKESLNFMEFKTWWGSTIRLLGLQQPKVVEGVPWDDLYNDEFPDTPANCFQHNMRPALATEGRDNRAWFIGVPDEAGTNSAEYEKLWSYGLEWPNRDHCAFWWPSSDIMSAEEFAAVSEDMDELTFRQEMLGMFVSSGNKAFPNYNAPLHVNGHYAEYSPFIPLDHTWDFGVRPAVSLIGQAFKNSIWIVDEIVLDDSSTDVAARDFLERSRTSGWDLSNGIRVFGDAAGRTPGSATGRSDYEIIKEEYESYNVEFKNLIYDPPVKDTINAVRRRLMDRTGRIRLHINPRCKRLREEMSKAPWPSNLREFHAVAALRYYIYALCDLGGVSSGLAGIGKATMTTNQMLSAKYTRR